MKLADHPPKVIDEVITEVRAIKPALGNPLPAPCQRRRVARNLNRKRRDALIVLQKMKIAWLQLPILMVCVASCVSTEPVAPRWVEVSTTRKVNESNLTETVTGIANGEQIKAITTFRRFHPNDRMRHEHWLGTDGGYPDYVVSSMTVTRNGEKIAIPYELYSDFGDFAFQGGFLRILQSDAGFAVKHYGSDGAGSFDGTFYFDANGLNRVVVSTLGFTNDGLVGRVQHTRKANAEQVSGGNGGQRH